MKKIVYILIFILTGVAIVEFLYFDRKCKIYEGSALNNFSEFINQQNVNNEKEMEDSLKTLSYNLKVNDIKLTDADNKTYKLSEVVKNSTLIYKFDEGSCTSCVSHTIETLNKVADKIGAYKIIIITNSIKGSRELSVFINGNNIKSRCYWSDQRFEIPIDSKDVLSEKSIFFILDNNLKILYPEIAHSKNKEDYYYYKAIEQYFNIKL